MNSFQKFLGELFQTLFSLLKIILLSKFFVSLKKYGSPNQEAVILANGPCLSKDLELNSDFISTRIKFCVNLFSFSDEYQLLKPGFYVLAAPEFWMKQPIEFHIKQRDKLAEVIVNKTSWPLILLIPVSAKDSEFLLRIKKNKNITTVFYNTTPIEGFKNLINRLFRLNLGMPRPHNVLIPTIFLAINLGFNKIILLGGDHSWHEDIKVDDNNLTTVNHQHFFEKQEVRMPMYKLDGNHYFIHDIFRKLHLAFKGYFVLKDYAQFRKVAIYNASSKSYIDAFERINPKNTF